MACNNCNDQSGQSPPAGFAPSPSNQSGSQSSYGGNTTVVSRRYGVDCPQPFTTGQTGRTAYAPAWVATLLGGTVGKMLIKVGDAIMFLRSRASGWIKYDAVTESVSVDNAPPFVSNVPKGTNFGYVAKTVPTIKQRFDDVTGECVSEGSQEVGSQIMYPRADGKLVLGNVPLAEELTVEQSADAANQTRLDYLEPAIAEAQSLISDDIGFLVNQFSTRTVGGHEVVSEQWLRMSKIRLRESQIGEVTGTAKSSAVQAVFKKVNGGTDLDPAMELAFVDAPPSDAAANFPSNRNQDDTLFYNDPALDAGHESYSAGWVAFPRGQGAHFMLPETVLRTGAVPASPASPTSVGTTTLAVTLDAFAGIPHPGVGVGLAVRVTTTINSATTSSLRISVDPLANGTFNEIATATNRSSAVPQITNAIFCFSPSAFTQGGGDVITFQFVKAGAVAMTCDIELVAYFL